MIGVTEFAFNELSKDFNNALYLTNGVDKNFISQKEKVLSPVTSILLPISTY